MLRSEEGERLLRLQHLLLPASLPPIGCTEAAAVYQCHNDDLRVGGDFYDLVDRSDDQVVVIIGDVVGHGIEQIGVMGQLRAAANALARVCSDPAEIVAGLNDFASELPGAQGTTMAVLMLDGTTTGRLTSAGHPPLLHYSQARNVAELVEVGRRPPIQTFDVPAETGAFEYDVDDLLVLYTDGLVERPGVVFDEVLEELGAFLGPLIDRPCHEIADAVMARFATAARDDVALVVLRPRNHRSPEYQLNRHLEPTVRIA